MPRSVLIFMLGLLLAACTPGIAPNAQPERFSTRAKPIILSERLNLTAYPGSGILELRDQGARTTAWFVTSVPLVALENHVEAQLMRGGWQRTRYDTPTNTHFSADFVNGDERLKVRIVLEHVSGRYRLEIR